MNFFNAEQRRILKHAGSRACGDIANVEYAELTQYNFLWLAKSCYIAAPLRCLLGDSHSAGKLSLAASDSSDDESEEQENVRKAPFDVVVSKDGVVVRESADRDKAGAFRSFMSVKNCFTETQRQGTRKKGGEYFFVR